MRFAFIHGLAAIIAGGSLFVIAPAAFAAPTTYVFEETSGVSGFNPMASITIDGGFADLPSVDTFSDPTGPYDFGNLLSFNFAAQGQNISLADFVAPSAAAGDIPQWQISPGGMLFLGLDNDFSVNFPSGTVTFDTDDPNGPCFESGVCVAEGNWVSAPEPFTVSILGAGLAGAVAMRRRRKAKA